MPVHGMALACVVTGPSGTPESSRRALPRSGPMSCTAPRAAAFGLMPGPTFRVPGGAVSASCTPGEAD